MNAKKRDFDVTGLEAGKLWDEIVHAGEDTVAVARASYEAGGKARHRLQATAWLMFDARFSPEARDFAVELLDDRSRKVVEAAARTLAWGWDVTLLPRIRAAAERRNDAARSYIDAAIAATEAGDPNLLYNYQNGGNARISVADHGWREKRGGLLRGAQFPHVSVLLDVAREASANHGSLVGNRQPRSEQEFRADIEIKACWVLGAPVGGYLVARARGKEWWIEEVAVNELGRQSGFARQLLAFAEQEGRRRGCALAVLGAYSKAAADLELFSQLGYIEAKRRDDDGIDRTILEKAL